jgi:hypothetical protein
VRDTRLGQHVAIEAREGVGAGVVEENPVAGMPAFITAILGPFASASRFARRSGQRWFVFGVDRVPSVMESPSATIAPAAWGAATSTRARTNHDAVVVATGSASTPA